MTSISIEEQILSVLTQHNTYSIDILNRLTEQNILLQGIYTVMLWAVGVSAAVLVLFLLYKFIRLFF